jgi:hypothetical protein
MLGAGKLSWLEANELPLVDDDMTSSSDSSAHAQKSLTRSPGRLKAADPRLDIWSERDERLGSHPNCFPIAAATPGFGACSWMMSTAIRWSEDGAASDSTE